MGVLAAVVFAAQLVNFPVPPSSGHLVGSTLLAVMLGPWCGMLIIGMVLFVQALYGDGGILTYGLNFFNMGINRVIMLPMIDDNHVAITLEPAGIQDLSIKNSAYRLASVCLYFDTALKIYNIEFCVFIRAERIYYFTFNRHIKQSF